MLAANSKLFGLASVLLTAGAVALSSLGLASAQPTSTNSAAVSEAGNCVHLHGRTFEGGRVEKSDYAPPGTLVSPFKTTNSVAVCRVHAVVSPTGDSSIKVDIWLPANWNGKLLGLGGGGFNGGLSNDILMLMGPVNKGYAGVASDAGHDVSDRPLWALGHPEKIVDFGYRSNHLAAVVAKAVIASYYEAPLKRSYFHGCSNGGRDALMLAERFPRDYDGIIVGAPANDWTALFAAFLHDRHVLEAFDNAMPSKLNLVHDAAIKQCDGQDGARDGLLSNPTTCRFDPVVLECKGAAGANCLTKDEVQAIRAIYEGTRTRDGRLIMPGFSRSSEYQWAAWMPGPKGVAASLAADFWRYMVYDKPGWDPAKADVDREYRAARQKLGAVVDATNPDLRPFVRHGGKLLMYHGWDDAAIPPVNSINFYNAIKRTLGPSSGQARLFMVPGMGHCFGGNGPSIFDPLQVIDAWVQGGRPPARLIAGKSDNDMAAMIGGPAKILRTRPICAWPKSPRYRGSGSVDEASSFVCS